MASLVDAHFTHGKLNEIPIQTWLGEHAETAELTALHKTLEDLVRVVEASTIVDLNEFYVWIENITEALVC